MDLVYYTEKDLAENGIDPAVITRSGIIILDDMYRSLREFVLDHADFKAAKVFGLSTVDNDPQRIMADKAVKAYARPLTQKNLAALVRFLLHRELGLDIAWGAPRRSRPRGFSILRATRSSIPLTTMRTGTERPGISPKRGPGSASPR